MGFIVKFTKVTQESKVGSTTRKKKGKKNSYIIYDTMRSTKSYLRTQN